MNAEVIYMEHLGSIRLESPSLILRAFKHEDAEAMYKNWANEPEVTKFLTWPTHKDPRESAKILEDWIKAGADPRFYLWAIELKGLGEPIGSISVVKQDDLLSLIQFGYCIGKNWWGQGYMTEALSCLIEFFFTRVGANRLEARHDINNPASGRVMEKAGMSLEGVYRKGDKNNQGICDVCMWSILKEDWDTQNEIAHYNSLPCEFKDFVSIPNLRDGELSLICLKKMPAIPEKEYVPAYTFALCINNEKIGELGLRIGYTPGLYYGGQIGYSVDEKYRGRGYAGRACRMLLPVARAHGMEKLIITNEVGNAPSRRVCEKLGAEFLRRAYLPSWHELYCKGQREVNIFSLSCT